MDNNTFHINTTITTKANNLNEVNHELSRLKLVIGVLLTKLQPNLRDEFIKDLEGLGLVDEAKTYSLFNPKN